MFNLELTNSYQAIPKLSGICPIRCDYRNTGAVSLSKSINPDSASFAILGPGDGVTLDFRSFTGPLYIKSSSSSGDIFYGIAN